MLVLGILLLITAYKNFTNEPDPDAPPPKWLTMLTTISPLGASGAGCRLAPHRRQDVGVHAGRHCDHRQAQLGQPSAAITFLLFVLLAESLLIIPTLIRLIFPTKAAALLGSFGDWLEKYNSQIVMVVSLIFGAASSCTRA